METNARKIKKMLFSDDYTMEEVRQIRNKKITFLKVESRQFSFMIKKLLLVFVANGFYMFIIGNLGITIAGFSVFMY